MNTLRYACEAGDFNTAHTSLASINPPHQALPHVQEFVKKASMAGHFETLLRLPFADLRMVVKGDRIQIVSMFEAVLDALKEWGRTAPLDSVPQPYLILYDLSIRHHRFHSAAEAMLKFVRKTRKECMANTAEGIRKMQTALGMDIHCCKMLLRDWPSTCTACGRQRPSCSCT